MARSSTRRRRTERVVARGGAVVRRSRRDVLATEEPLEIRLVPPAVDPAAPGISDHAHRVSVTMRTPGHDFELAAGFLYGEGLVQDRREIRTIRYCVEPGRDGPQRYNIVNVFLAPGASFDPSQLQRNFYTTSSCGVCGKASIEAVEALSCPAVAGGTTVSVETLLSLPARLRERQRVFARTGGLHAAALFAVDGTLVAIREDVGRHNAMDKLVGNAFLGGELPLGARIALMSGRLSFELVQKAARAGVSILAGVSAPSTLAVELAETVGMTLVGFLRRDRFNVYAGSERIAGPAPATDGPCG